ncbi:hypothetical protein CR513_29957, partial [Mucuna pruriens]
MKDKPFASALVNLMYAQVCTRHDISFIVERVDNMEIVGHTNSDLGGCPEDRKSTSRYVFMMAKFIACFVAFTHTAWLRNLVVGLCTVESIARPLRIFCDNKLKYSTIRDFVKDGSLVVEHVDTYSMLVDPLTKGLRLVFKIHVESICIVSSFY